MEVVQTLFQDYTQTAVEEARSDYIQDGNNEPENGSLEFFFLLSDSEYFSISDHVAVLIISM